MASTGTHWDERFATSVLRCLFDELDYVFGFVGSQLFPCFSRIPIQNELDFLRFLIDNEVGLHDRDYLI